MSDDDVIALIARQKTLNFAPGAEYSYSNSGYVLLSVIVKRVTGRSLREYADEQIFKPLGMRNTHFHDDRLRVVKRRVIGYDPGPGGRFRIHYYANFEGVGDGGLWTTVEDLALWDRNFYDPQVGGPEFLAQLQTSGRLANGDTLPYASGLVHGRYRGLRTVSHGGASLTFVRDGRRHPVAFLVRTARVRDIRFERMRRSP
ncbi:MAG: serine hydrolase domain-containing protein [Gemmatimonadaceae bacterium]